MINNKMYNRINNLVGWIVFAISAFTYISTMEKAGSFWDCGEFASCIYHLGNSHPPGNPLFILLGRMFVILFGNFMPAIRAINLMSAIGSAFTILFLFWTITYFAKRLLVKESNSTIDKQTIFRIMSAGIVGSLAYNFSDSFWFSGVEAIVFALSPFFTALTFWAMTKWDTAVLNNDKSADRWIVFIAFTIGLAIGVHLLNILTIPAIIMIYYFRKYNRPNTKGAIIAFLIGCIITGLVMKGVRQWSVQLMAYFDIWFVNSWGLPFYSGMIFCTLLYIILCIILMKYAIKKGYNLLRLGVWCFSFMMFGYSSYVTTIIRANANPYVNMYAVNNPATLVDYTNREQYGDFPLLYGPIFTAKPIDTKNIGTTYTRWKDKYIVESQKFENVFAPEDEMFLSRIWDYTNSQDHVEAYRMWLDLDINETPTYADNIKWFLAYQWNWMYWRYFMWNFAGRQNDVQNVDGNIMHGNWISGIPFLDNLRLGDQSTLPTSLKEGNKAYNRLYFLPLLLGIFGLLFSFKKNQHDFVIVLLLFFFTGIAIILYLNQPGNQPRERDYAFACSFYTFTIWIGLGVLQVQEWLYKKIKMPTANAVAAIVCFLAVPTLMAQQEWNNHDRSKKTLARDMGIDYLQSCPPNALLVTYGDNDTYPLWYVQEVEGIRPDVRAVNSSLLGASWYINQLTYKVNNSKPFEFPFPMDSIVGGRNDILYVNQFSDFDPNQYYDLSMILKVVIDEQNPRFLVETNDGTKIGVLPTHKFYILINKEEARQNPSIYPNEKIEDTIYLEIPNDKKYIYKNDLAVLAIIAKNHWNRPICFTSPEFINTFHLNAYARKDGLVTELLPVKANATGYNIPWTVSRIDSFMSFTSPKTKGVYYDEENRRHLISLRLMFVELANAYLQKGQKDKALEVLQKSLQDVPEFALSFASCDRSIYQTYLGFDMVNIANACGDSTLAKTIYGKVIKEVQQTANFFNANKDRLSGAAVYMKQQYDRILKGGL